MSITRFAIANAQPALDLRAYGALADEVVFTGSMTSGSNVLTRTAGTFTAGDVGKVLSVPGAGPVQDWNPARPLPTTVAAYLTPTTVQLTATAAATSTGVTIKMATDSSAAVQACFDAAAAAGGGTVLIPPGRWYAARVFVGPDTDVVGQGWASELVMAPQNYLTDSDNGALLAAYASPVSPYGTDSTRLIGTRIMDLAIDGNKTAHTGDISNRTRGEGLNFRWGKYGQAVGLRIRDTTGDGIDFDNSQDMLVTGCVISGCASLGIHHSNGNSRNLVIGNTVENCGHDMALTSGGGQPGLDVGSLSDSIVFIGNTAKDCYRNWSITGTGGFILLGNRSLGTPIVADSLSGMGDVDLPGGITKFAGALSLTGNLTLVGQLLASANIWSTLASTSSVAYRSRVTGDTQDRFNMRAGGGLWWGDGATASLDVTLSRGAADLLQLSTGDTFKVDGTWNGGQLRLGNYRLWVDAGGLLRMKSSAPASDTDGTVIGTQT